MNLDNAYTLQETEHSFMIVWTASACLIFCIFFCVYFYYYQSYPKRATFNYDHALKELKLTRSIYTSSSI